MYTQISGNFFFQQFSFHSTLLPGFLEFSVERFAFRKFNSFRNFWKLFREISESFAAVSKFSKVLVQWKGPLLLKFAKMLFHSLLEVAENSNRTFWTLVEWNGNSCSISSKPSLIPVSGLRGLFSVNGTDVYKG